jgi:polyisoprenoid-binding protein YceI
MKRLLLAAGLLLLVGHGTPARGQAARLIKEESLVIYKMVHPLHSFEATSKDVTYRLEFDAAKKEIKRVEAQVDVTTFDSGNSNRDSHAMEVIDAISFPDVKFVSSAITQTGDSLHVAGSLTFHGVTKEIVATGSAQWSQNRLRVQGAFDLSLTEFSIERPSLLMLPVEDKLSFSFVAEFALE